MLRGSLGVRIGSEVGKPGRFLKGEVIILVIILSTESHRLSRQGRGRPGRGHHLRSRTQDVSRRFGGCLGGGPPPPDNALVEMQFVIAWVVTVNNSESVDAVVEFG
jgi:hypothetical protein